MTPLRLSRRALCLAAGSLALCAPGAAAQSAVPVPAARVAIRNFAFAPATVTVPAGTRVVWTNRDEEPHAIRSADPALPFQSAALDTGETFALTFDKPGRYAYFCSIHPHMVGTVIVQ